MLNKLQLTNFKRHRDLSIDFTDGINATRGSNEAGKSSSLHAIAYALFGAKALPHSLDDAVTWGEDVKTLKVALSIIVEGTSYTFTRGKSGAEVLREGAVFVTGQNEVSTFAANLLGADASQAVKLMFANQNGLRGALEEGPKALSTMIEDLAGFSTFDQILDAAQEKLALGNPGMLEERLKGAKATLEAASQNLPAKPDAAAHEQAVAALTAKAEMARTAIPELKAKATSATSAWMEAATQYGKLEPMKQAVTTAEGRVSSSYAEVQSYSAAADKAVDTSPVEGIKAAIVAAEGHGTRLAAFQFLQNLPKVAHFAGTEEEFNAAWDQNQNGLKETRSALAQADNEVTKVLSQRISHDKCDKCGQDIKHLDHVQATNARVDTELAALNTKIKALQGSLGLLTSTEVNLQVYRTAARSMPGSVASKLAPYCAADTSAFPARWSWVGDEPSAEVPDIDALRRQLKVIEDEVKAVEQAKVKLEMAKATQVKAEVELAAAEKALTDFVCPSPDQIAALELAKHEADATYQQANTTVLQVENEVKELNQAHASTTSLWGMAQSRINDAEKTIADCQKDLDSLAFNNGLVKKLRTIRPLIADKLWNTVLSSVSVMFSQMRGEESWVSKGKDGFKVNGQSVESLSGSTLDILGLAIRCSLIKTFLPQCSLLILDEPAHGCDAERTEALIGFIAGSGFNQTLLVTHEEISEAVANNIIQL